MRGVTVTTKAGTVSFQSILVATMSTTPPKVGLKLKERLFCLSLMVSSGQLMHEPLHTSWQGIPSRAPGETALTRSLKYSRP